MILTLADVISRSTTLAGGRLDWAVSEVSFYANLAATEVFEQVYHTPLEALAISSTTSGENRYTVPADFDGPISLSNLSTRGGWTWFPGGGRGLDQVEAAWISSQVTQSGEPQVYALYSEWLELWPTPDSGYSLELRYYARQPPLVASTATPAFHDRWHQGWLWKTAEHLELSRNNYESAAVWSNRYVSYMNSIPNDRAKRQLAKGGMGLRYQRDAE